LLSPDAISEAVEWYAANRQKFVELTEEVAGIIKKTLRSSGVKTYAVIPRAKDIERYKEKLKREKEIHYDPKEMQDLAGIRIVGFLNRDAQRISDIIRNTFEIDENRTKTKAASPDVVGYRFITQFVAKLNRERANLPDFARFKGIHFEIQVMTVLQHAWAEIQHDDNYKGMLRDDLRRRFNLIAGVLEVVDNEFENIMDEVEIYKKATSKARRTDLDIPIEPASLSRYMHEKFGIINGVDPTIGSQTDYSADIIQKLAEMKITTLEELDRIVPPRLKEAYTKHANRLKVCPQKYTYASILSHIMIYKDPELYSIIRNDGKPVPMFRLSFDILTFSGADPGILKKYWIISNDPTA
jgi:putative GTP pyrophosphokinase